MEKLAPVENVSLGGIWAQMDERVGTDIAAAAHCTARLETLSVSSWTVF